MTSINKIKSVVIESIQYRHVTVSYCIEIEHGACCVRNNIRKNSTNSGGRRCTKRSLLLN